MINHLQEFEDELDDFLYINVKFHTKYNKYLFQGKWTSQTNSIFFESKIDKLKIALWNQLNNGKNNKLFLSNLRDKIRISFAIFLNEDYQDFSFFEKLKIKINTTSSESDLLPDEVFDYNYFLNQSYLELYKEDYFSKLDDESVIYHNYIKTNFDNEKTSKIEFERIKLAYSLSNYQDALFNFLNYIEYLFFNYKFIDFSKNENIKSKDEDEDTIEEVYELFTNEKKCKLNINKKSLAELINFLMIEKIIYFDSVDTAKNKILLQNFFEKNFTFKNTDGNQKEIRSLNKEISENHFEIKKNYNTYLDRLSAEIKNKKKV